MCVGGGYIRMSRARLAKHCFQWQLACGNDMNGTLLSTQEEFVFQDAYGSERWCVLRTTTLFMLLCDIASVVFLTKIHLVSKSNLLEMFVNFQKFSISDGPKQGVLIL